MNNPPSFCLVLVLSCTLAVAPFGCTLPTIDVHSHLTHANSHSSYRQEKIQITEARDIPEVEFLYPDFDKDLTNNSNGTEGNFFDGILQGSLVGMGVGSLICTDSELSDNHSNEDKDAVDRALSQLLLCGFSLATGATIGALVGGITGPFLPQEQTSPEEFENEIKKMFAGINVYTGIRNALVRIYQPETLPTLTNEKDLKKSNFHTGNEKDIPEETSHRSKLTIAILKIGLEPQERVSPSQFHLVIQVRSTLTRSNGELIAVQELESKSDSHTYRQWANGAASLLRKTLHGSYESLAQSINGELLSPSIPAAI